MKAKLVAGDHFGEVWRGDSLNPACIEAVMGTRIADALIFDAPYSVGTHQGHSAGRLMANSARRFVDNHSANPTAESRYASRKLARGDGRRDLAYSAFTKRKIDWFCKYWLPRCRGWVVSITDETLAPLWRAAFERGGLYAFGSLPLVETGSRVRIQGDGPSSWACWIVVARPRTLEFSKWGTLPGAYMQPGEREINSVHGNERIVGGKPLRSMMSLVRDYTAGRDALVVDPMLGGGTTGIAARMMGRRFIGIERDAEHVKIAARRVCRAREQLALFEAVGQ